MPSAGFERATLPWKRLERVFVHDGGPSAEAWREQVLSRRGERLVQVSVLDSSARMPDVGGWELRFRLDVDPKMERPELVWHYGGRGIALDVLTPALLSVLKSVTVRAPPELQKQVKKQLGSKFAPGAPLTRAQENAPPFERLTSS